MSQFFLLTDLSKIGSFVGVNKLNLLTRTVWELVLASFQLNLVGLSDEEVAVNDVYYNFLTSRTPVLFNCLLIRLIFNILPYKKISVEFFDKYVKAKRFWIKNC